ncbi:MAG: hypothetical protein V7696_10505 [Halioglobus sp.]
MRLSQLTILLVLCLTAAVSHASSQQILRDGRSLELDISSQFSDTQRQHVVDWVSFIAENLSQVYGHWPRKQWRVEVQPISGSYKDTIPWGQVNRGQPDTVLFYVLNGASTQQLIDNWTGYHEFAHLLIPYKGGGDRWFSEGLASYYQNILQARAGVISEQVMWQKLLDGFIRGREQDQFNGIALSQVSDDMRENRAYMRVYWSGAWYFFAADVQLRQQSGGTSNLDTALAALNKCCADRQMSAKEMVVALDRENRLLLFEPLFTKTDSSTRLPEFEAIFASLGISIEGDQVVLQTEGPGADLRRNISQRKTL